MPEDTQDVAAQAEAPVSGEESSTQETEQETEVKEVDEGDKEPSIPLSRFREVNRKMREYEEEASVARELSQTTGLSYEEIRARLKASTPKEQSQGGTIDHEARKLALEAKRDSQIARLTRENPEAATLVDYLEEDFMAAAGKKSISEIYDKYKKAIAIGRSAKQAKQAVKQSSQVEGTSSSAQKEQGELTREQFASLSLAEKTNYLKKRGLIN